MGKDDASPRLSPPPLAARLRVPPKDVSLGRKPWEQKSRETLSGFPGCGKNPGVNDFEGVQL